VTRDISGCLRRIHESGLKRSIREADSIGLDPLRFILKIWNELSRRKERDAIVGWIWKQAHKVETNAGNLQTRALGKIERWDLPTGLSHRTQKDVEHYGPAAGNPLRKGATKEPVRIAYPKNRMWTRTISRPTE